MCSTDSISLHWLKIGTRQEATPSASVHNLCPSSLHHCPCIQHPVPLQCSQCDTMCIHPAAASVPSPANPATAIRRSSKPKSRGTSCTTCPHGMSSFQKGCRLLTPTKYWYSTWSPAQLSLRSCNDGTSRDELRAGDSLHLNMNRQFCKTQNTLQQAVPISPLCEGQLGGTTQCQLMLPADAAPAGPSIGGMTRNRHNGAASR
jgi:hypothetical protein